MTLLSVAKKDALATAREEHSSLVQTKQGKGEYSHAGALKGESNHRKGSKRTKERPASKVLKFSHAEKSDGAGGKNTKTSPPSETQSAQRKGRAKTKENTVAGLHLSTPKRSLQKR